MANPNWTKGVSGNPKGRVKMPEEVRRLDALTKAQTKALFAKLVNTPLEELQEMAKDKSKSTLEHVVIRVLLMGIKHGDATRLDRILDRIIGKVKEEKELSFVKPRIIHDISDGSKTILSLESGEDG